MTILTISEVDRRRFLAGATLFALATGVSLPLTACKEAEGNPRHRALAEMVSAHVIPRTDTPGAAETGVGAFVLLALAHGLEESRKPVQDPAPALKSYLHADGSLDHMTWLADELDKRTGGDVLNLASARQQALIAALDAEAYAEGVRAHPWRTIKALILTGYYTSEAGASKELRYEHVPGRWDPDVPLKPGDRAFSSDWTAVEFG